LDEEPIAVADYTLPDLPYDHGALDPHIAGEIMGLHHSKHHNTYVTTLNSVIDQLAQARSTNDFGTIAGLEKSLAFNLGGTSTTPSPGRTSPPDGGGKPQGAYNLGLVVLLHRIVSRRLAGGSPCAVEHRDG
jgi:Fe-Mn family superoxide dismutase